MWLGFDSLLQYERKKVLDILQNLQTLQPILENFNDSSFRSSVIFPYFKLTKKRKTWIITLTILEQLYLYRYPFQFTNYFLSWNNNYQLQVKIEIIQIISSENLQKQFYVQDFLNKFKVSNNKKTQIKITIIEALDEAINNQLIYS